MGAVILFLRRFEAKQDQRICGLILCKVNKLSDPKKGDLTVDTKIIDGIVPKIQRKIFENLGVRLFADQGSRFEQWLHIEICGLLEQAGMKTTPEKSDGQRSIDIYFRDNNSKEYWVEIKVVGLKSSYGDCKKATTLSGVWKDVGKLKNMRNACRIIMIATFPGSIRDNKSYFDMITGSVFELKSADFKFQRKDDSEMTGCLYWGLLK